MHHYYDIIIVDAGIAGLYSAYTIRMTDPSKSFLVLERDKKAWIGGRIGNDTFYGVTVVTGAGVGRKQKDKLLVHLLKELHIPTKECEIQMNYAKTIPQVVDVGKTIRFLKQEYQKERIVPGTFTFAEFAKRILGSRMYTLFTISAGYTDYEKENVYDTLYHYGMEDNHPGWKSLIIPWKQLVAKLCEKIGFSRIRYKTTVTKVIPLRSQDDERIHFRIDTDKATYFCNKVIIATNINGIKSLVPVKHALYEQIHGQPFLRVYAKLDEASVEIMKQYVPFQTLVPGPLHKLIPVNDSRGVYMIAYTDNAGALFLKPYLENNAKDRRFFEILLERSLGFPENSIHITAIKSYYWPIGTHYYSTLKGFKTRKAFIQAAQQPMENMLVVGEAVSLNQGWTEGALESVHSVLNKNWI